MNTIEQNLQQHNLTLPEAAAPVANYVPYSISGKRVFISGQLPMQDGKPAVLGKLGEYINLEEGVEAAKLCALNLLAQLKAACGGDLSKIARCIRLGIFVNSTDDFTDQPKVANGASDVMVQALGDAGKHCRAAVGVNTLPLGVAVEVEGIFEVV